MDGSMDGWMDSGWMNDHDSEKTMVLRITDSEFPGSRYDDVHI